MKILFTGRSG